MNTLDLETDRFAQLNIDNKPHLFQLDRRTFLQLFGGGLLVCLTNAGALAQESGRARLTAATTCPKK